MFQKILLHSRNLIFRFHHKPSSCYHNKGGCFQAFWLLPVSPPMDRYSADSTCSSSLTDLISVCFTSPAATIPGSSRYVNLLPFGRFLGGKGLNGHTFYTQKEDPGMWDPSVFQSLAGKIPPKPFSTIHQDLFSGFSSQLCLPECMIFFYTKKNTSQLLMTYED